MEDPRCNICEHDQCFLKTAADMPLTFWALNSEGIFVFGAGKLWEDLYTDLIGNHFREVFDGEVVSYYEKAFELDEPIRFIIRNRGQVWDAVLTKTPDGGLQGVAMVSLEALHRLNLQELRQGLANHELTIWLQPIVDLRINKIVGQEALLRWNREGRILSPGEFLHFADKELLQKISLFVAQEALKMLMTQRLKNIDHWIAINIDPRIIDPPFLTDFESHISTSMYRKLLHLEITEEQALDENLSWFLAYMRRKFDLKVKVDDYGSKGSTDARIAILPIDGVKLDSSLLQSTLNDKNERNYAYEMDLKRKIEFCKGLALEIIAEGVETEAQKQWLLDNGVCLGQGYLLGRPGKFEH
jgi:EAL domain-containing protein (putative c-di-GMP-specific phosphodiesterase class I)